MAKSNFVVRGGADFSKMYKEFNTAQTRMKTFQAGMNKAFKLAGAVVGALGVGKLIKSSTQMAMTVESSVDNIRRNMREASKTFETFAQTQSKSLGMARKEAYSYGSTFSNLLGSFISDSGRIASETQDIMKAAAVIASKTGRTYEDVAGRIRSGMLGSTEAIEDLGVYTQVSMLESTEAFKKFANSKSWNQLDFRVQQQIRLAAILEQTYDRYGDTLANTTQTKQAMFLASLKNIQLNLGQAFLPIYNVVLPALTALASKLESITAYIASISQSIFGEAKPIQNTESYASAVGGVGAALDDAGESAEKAGKKAKKALAPFDQLNILSSESGGGAGGSGLSTELSDTSNIEQPISKTETAVDRLKKKFDELSKTFKKGFALGFGEPNTNNIIDSANNIKKSLQSIFASPEVTNAADNWVSRVTESLGKVTGSFASVGSTAAELLIGSMDKYLSQNSGFLKNKITSLLDTFSKTTEVYPNLAAAMADIYTVFRNDTAKQIGADLIAIFANSFLSIAELGWGFGADLMTAITQPIIDNKDAVKLALENTLKPVRKIVGTIKDFLNKSFASIKISYDTYITPALDNFSKGFNTVFKGVMDGYNQYLAPTINKISGKFSELVDKYLTPLMAKASDFIGSLVFEISRLWDFLSPFISWLAQHFFKSMSSQLEALWTAFELAFKGITSAVNTFLGVAQGLLDFIAGVFTGDWDRAWSGIKQIFTSYIGGLKDTVTNLGTFISSVFGGIGDNIKNTFKGAINGVISLFNKFIGWVNSKLRFSWEGLKIAGKTIFDGGSVQLAKIPTIPALAKGGIVDNPTLAMIGEQGKEAVVPLENTSFVTTLASAIANEISKVVGNNKSQDGNGDVILKIGELEFGRVAIKAINETQRGAGKTLLIV